MNSRDIAETDLIEYGILVVPGGEGGVISYKWKFCDASLIYAVSFELTNKMSFEIRVHPTNFLVHDR